jgi:hypothetical protein
VIVGNGLSDYIVSILLKQFKILDIEVWEQQVFRTARVLGSRIYVIGDDEFAALSLSLGKIHFEPVYLILSFGTLTCKVIFLIHIKSVNSQDRELGVDVYAVVSCILKSMFDLFKFWKQSILGHGLEPGLVEESIEFVLVDLVDTLVMVLAIVVSHAWQN